MSSTARGTPACPEAQTLAEWVLSSDPVGLHHLSKCRRCAQTAGEFGSGAMLLCAHAEEIFDLSARPVAELLGSAIPPVTNHPGSLQRKWHAAPRSVSTSPVRAPPQRVVAAIFAAVAVCVGALLTTPVQLAPGGELRGQTMTLIAAATFDPSTKILRLAWHEVAVADRYVVRVWNSEGRLLKEQTLAAPSTELDMAIRPETLRTYWAIDAWAGHTRVGRSGMGETELSHQY